jgi:phage baseplate assembly protein W
MPLFYGFNAPFMGGKEKVLSRQVDEKLIRNDLLQLLLTAPGERVMRPDFGSPIRPFLFELMTATDLSILKDGIIAAIEKFEPRVTVTDVALDSNDNGTLVITVFGYFQINRFRTGAKAIDSDVLVQLNIPTKTNNQIT